MNYDLENIETFKVFNCRFQSINLDTYTTSKSVNYPNIISVCHKMIDGRFATIPIELDKVGVSADQFIEELNRVLTEKQTNK